jgi:cystathionine beta-lyase/cystathionine gamma-synthase
VPVNPRRTASSRPAGALVRFNIGLEEPSDLIADLERGLRVLQQ